MRLSYLWRIFLRRLRIEYRLALWHLNRRLRRSLTVKTQQGIFTLPLAIDDPISRVLFTDGRFELDLIHDAMAIIRNQYKTPKGQGTIIDIGANNGAIAIGMLVTGELDRALAIEPDPDNFARLQHNVRQNKLQEAITCLNLAVADRKTSLPFARSHANYGDHRVHQAAGASAGSELFDESQREIITVEADTLPAILHGVDDLAVEEIAVVWIDVQGYEGFVFAGAQELLSRGIPVVAEIWPYGIRRAGMNKETFCATAAGIWPAYWQRRRGRFIKYPIEILPTLFDELGDSQVAENVIFTR